ncbi:MAG: hypothetical protein V1869_00055 [Candidatus Omnitrophota bacterium]
MSTGTRAQAATEFAILGMLIIVAFSFLINYSEKLNRQQSYIMQTFRAALKTARQANDSASYTRVVFRRMPNISNPMELGQMQSFSSSSNVLWSTGEELDKYGYYVEKKGVNKYQLNEAGAIDVTQREDANQPAEGEVETNASSFQDTIDANRVLVKNEGSGNILTTKTLNAADTLQANVALGFDNATNQVVYQQFNQYLGSDGKYYPDQTSLQRSRSMQ